MAFAYEAPIVSLLPNKDLPPAFLVSISLAKMLQIQREDMLSEQSTSARGR
jgi:hypothetical protein